MVNTKIIQLKIILNKPKYLFNFFKIKIKTYFLWNVIYNTLREPKLKSTISNDSQTYSKIRDQLKLNGFKVIDYYIDENDFKDYLIRAKYSSYIDYFFKFKPLIFIEKCLEHYLAAKFLNLSEKDIYIDIANAYSPAPEIYHKLYGCSIYKQDLIFPKGIHGNIIGGNAANLPIKDDFATKIALHCSFEHFENNSDIGFINEASRVLKKGGKLCILPLYLFNKYAIQTDPSVLIKSDIYFEKDAILYCAKGWGNRFGRHYNVPQLKKRIKNNAKDLDLTIFFVKNEKEINKNCYIKFIALFEKS